MKACILYLCFINSKLSELKPLTRYQLKRYLIMAEPRCQHGIHQSENLRFRTLSKQSCVVHSSKDLDKIRADSRIVINVPKHVHACTWYKFHPSWRTVICARPKLTLPFLLGQLAPSSPFMCPYPTTSMGKLLPSREDVIPMCLRLHDYLYGEDEVEGPYIGNYTLTTYNLGQYRLERIDR